MPEEICKIIICSVNRLEALAVDMTTVINGGGLSVDKKRMLETLRDCVQISAEAIRAYINDGGDLEIGDALNAYAQYQEENGRNLLLSMLGQFNPGGRP